MDYSIAEMLAEVNTVYIPGNIVAVKKFGDLTPKQAF